MKKLKLLLFTVLIIAAFAAFTCAYADNETFVYDLFNDCMPAEDEARLNKMAQEIYEKYDYAVYYVVTATGEGVKTETYAEDFFLEHTPCVDGFVFVDNCGVDFGRHYYAAATAGATIAPNWTDIDKEYLREETFFKGAEYLYGKIDKMLGSIQADELHRVKEIENKPAHLLDDADVLTDAEEAALLAKLDEVAASRGFEAFVIAEDTMGGRMPMAYANKVFSAYTLGSEEEMSGIMLLFAKDTGDWWLMPLGGGTRAFTDSGIEYIGNEITQMLIDGKYNEAFNRYADLCGTFIEQAETGTPYNEENMLEPTVEVPSDKPASSDLGINIWVIIAVILGIAVIAFIIINMRKQSFYVYDEDEEKKTGYHFADDEQNDEPAEDDDAYIDF